MAYTSPFYISESENILTTYCNEHSLSDDMTELRIQLGNWRSQVCMHRLSPTDLEDFDPTYLNSYSLSRGGDASDLTLSRVSDTIKNALSVHVEWDFENHTWGLRLAPENYGAFPSKDTLLNLGMNMATELKRAPVYLFYDYVHCPDTQKDDLFAHNWGPRIMNWEFGWTKSAPDFDLFHEDSYYTGSRDEIERRWYDPLTWFKNQLGAVGIDYNEYYYILGQTNTDPSAAADEEGFHMVFGAEYIRGPIDAYGRTIFAIRTTNYCYNSGIGLQSYNAGGVPYYAGCYADMDLDNMVLLVGTSSSNSKSVAGDVVEEHLDLPYATIYSMTQQDTYSGYWSVDEYSCLVLNHLQDYEFDIGKVIVSAEFLEMELFLSQLGLEAVEADDSLPGCKTTSYVSMSPRFEEVRLGRGTVSAVSSLGQMKYIIYAIPKINLQLPVTVICEELERMRDAEGTSESKAIDYQNSIDSLNDNLSSGLYVTAYDYTFGYPTETVWKDTELYNLANKASVDLLNYDLGNDQTISKALAKISADKEKGYTYCSFARHSADVYEVDTLIDTRFSTYGLTGWNVVIDQDLADSSFVFSAYRDGVSSFALGDLEFGILYAKGNVIENLTQSSIEEVYESLYFSEEEIDDLLQTSPSLSQCSSTFAYDGGTLGSTVFDPNLMVDSFGYPVAKYSDTDSSVRAITMFKGFGDDGTGLVCAMFFTNLLDITS